MNLADTISLPGVREVFKGKQIKVKRFNNQISNDLDKLDEQWLYELTG